MDMEGMEAEKKHFLETVVPQWEDQAKERESTDYAPIK